jgi:hypothetical protein
MSNSPQVALWLTIPDTCKLVGEFEPGDEAPDIHFTVGSNGEDKHLMFERVSLERFVELASRMLSVPHESESRAVPATRLIGEYGYDIREEESRFAA